jgi:hypothetical protein
VKPEVAGPRLRARRETLGRTIDDVARATRIPAAHIEALEDGRLEELPAGPYAAAYVRTLLAELGLEASESEEAPPRVEPPGGAPLWIVRALAVSSLFALFVVLASWAWERSQVVVSAPRATSAKADQEVVVAARRTTRVTIRADGEVVVEGDLSGGEQRTVRGRDRIEVEVAQLSALSLRWNGVDIVPQGVQDAPRRLVFVDDADGADWP